MQKIYVLLRNDQQTGPYSLEEISKLDLKPYDLIWIEGRSAGWYYPQEIGALHPYLSFMPKKHLVNQQGAAQSKSFDALPKAPQPEPAKAEPPVTLSIPLPEETYVPLRPASINLEEKVYGQFKDFQQETTSFAAGSTKQAKSPGKTIGVGILSVLIIGGVFAASWFMNRTSGESGEAGETAAAVQPSGEINSTVPVSIADKQNTNASTAGQKRKKGKNEVSKASAQRLPPVQQKQGTQTVGAANDDSPVDEPAISPSVEQPAVGNETAETTVEKGAPVEKKKKLRDKIFDLFKKGPEEQKTGEAKPEDNSERNSTRRETGANLAQMVHVRFTVPNDWMMGIKGAKATLVNRSAQTVSKATVEVLYYDDENQLLQKKIITFNRVDGKESQTVGIPDHPTATKVDYTVLSAEEKPAA